MTNNNNNNDNWQDDKREVEHIVNSRHIRRSKPYMDDTPEPEGAPVDD